MNKATGLPLQLRPMPCELFRTLLGVDWDQPVPAIERELAWLCQAHFGQMGHEDGYAGPGSRAYQLAHSLSPADLGAVLSVRTQEGQQTEVVWTGALAEGSSLQDLAFATDWISTSLCKALAPPVRVGFSFGLEAWEAAGRPAARVGLARVERPSKEPFELALNAHAYSQRWELRGAFFRVVPPCATS